MSRTEDALRVRPTRNSPQPKDRSRPIRARKASAFAKEVERQEDFLSELRDFEDKLRRAASLHLEPDLNDGVVLNIAPLTELVPWKEAKTYGKNFSQGNTSGPPSGKQLRQKGLVKVMAIVTEHLFQLIATQVNDRGLVVWYDPEQAFGLAAAELQLPKTTVVRYDGSFFELRKEIDHLLDHEQTRLGWSSMCRLNEPKRTAPLSNSIAPGSSCNPGNNPRPAILGCPWWGRNALKPISGEDQVAEIERTGGAGKCRWPI